MNQLLEKFTSGFSILCFPTNQFGHQENTENGEILNSLKHVRPGNGFEPKATMFEKIQVNGDKEHELFTFLKGAVPCPGNDFMDDPKKIIWAPVRRNDIRWNFEKFLIGKDGNVIKRFDRHDKTIDCAADIEAALKA
eukprot:GFYU01007503.1.p1 GENE.GFYU01007503.1~~GFYU01007503.1.p1  ORF type:complete len:137 (-),score=53.76 GFYU01007503.1:517-927(-)